MHSCFMTQITQDRSLLIPEKVNRRGCLNLYTGVTSLKRLHGPSKYRALIHTGLTSPVFDSSMDSFEYETHQYVWCSSQIYAGAQALPEKQIIILLIIPTVNSRMSVFSQGRGALW